MAEVGGELVRPGAAQNQVAPDHPVEDLQVRRSVHSLKKTGERKKGPGEGKGGRTYPCAPVEDGGHQIRVLELEDPGEDAAHRASEMS